MLRSDGPAGDAAACRPRRSFRTELTRCQPRARGAPAGFPHTYRVGDGPARWLDVSVPSSFEQFVEDVAALDEQTPEAAAAERGIEILGPPGAMP